MDIMARLADWHITPPLIEHPPLHTCDDADRLLVDRPGTRLKTCFCGTTTAGVMPCC
ncbi:hypothetical protein MBH78_18565 [Oceanimonas sp. NS1]|nr:hypothetical protein [Oceanimonas sp. NS1]